MEKYNKPYFFQNNNNGKKKNTSNNPNPEQWTKWQERDFQLVDNYYEKDLEQVIHFILLFFDKAIF